MVEIRNLKLKPSYFLASIDARRLFDNVETSEVVSFLRPLLEKYEDIWRENTPEFAAFGHEELLSLLDCIMNNTYLNYDGKIYRQKMGVPMGSPISVTVSDIWVGTYENHFLVTKIT